VGRLWCALSDFYIRQSMFERARDVYQEGVEAVVTVRDFSLVFEALTKFEQALIEAQIEAAGEEADEMIVDGDDDNGGNFLLADNGIDIDLRLERLEWLLARRPLLLSSVMLRQNPHAVQARCSCILMASIRFVLASLLVCWCVSRRRRRCTNVSGWISLPENEPIK
jgi:pre-mRNA-splicing factor SYF1